MREIRLETCRPDEEIDLLEGKSIGKTCFVDEPAYDILLQEDAVVYKPNGEILLIFKKKVLSIEACRLAWPALRKAAKVSNNRGAAAGEVPEDPEERVGERAKKAVRVIGRDGKPLKRGKPLKKDGTMSSTSYAQEVISGIIGYYDRNTRFPYCRTTAYTMHNPEMFAKAIPLIQEISKEFKRSCPERYFAQKEKVLQTQKEYVIPKTVFTTVTVNKDWPTSIHKDKGDLKEGFGVMTALRAGNYTGCYLCFPKYRVAVDMCTQDLLLADVHEWHGNTPQVGIEGMYERLSLVLYYRAGMIECLPEKEEAKRAQARKRGDPVNGPLKSLSKPPSSPEKGP